ncbi:hypothetical protein [Flavobacterium pedocola]
MIIYGTKGSNIKNGQIINTECPNCNTKSTMDYSIFGKYAHVYWIPFFPYTKLTFVECGNCKRTFEKNDFTPEITQKLEHEKNKNGKLFFPVWMFSGIAIVALISGFGIYQSNVDDENDKAYLNDPKVNDVYHLKTENGFFTSAKVTNVDKDSVYLSFNTYEINQETGISDIDIAKNYEKESYGISRERITELFKKDTIYSVKRD